MKWKTCNRQNGIKGSIPCTGLSVYQDDPRYMIGYEKLRYFHCLICGNYEFIKQAEPNHELYNAAWWLAVATERELRTTSRENKQLKKELVDALAVFGKKPFTH